MGEGEGMSAVKIALVGDKGRMGRLLTSRFSAAGCEVAGVDRPLTPDTVRPAVQGADVVILCVPVEVLAEVLSIVAPLLSPKQVLADITSVKVRPMEVMQAFHAGPVVGTHPLFGPDPQDDHLPVAVTPSSLKRCSHSTMSSSAGRGRLACTANEKGRRRFSRTEPSATVGVCCTSPIRDRSTCGASSSTGVPSYRMTPDAGTSKRTARRSNVDFPPPEGPPTRTKSPRCTASVMPESPVPPG